MVVKVSKPEINVREKISELDKPSGVAGQAMLAAETPQEQFNLISAGRKNLFYNGAMSIAQRTTAAVIQSDGSNEGYATVDRWKVDFGSAMGGAVTSQQVGTTSIGGGEFRKALKLQCSTVNSGAMTGGSNRFLSVASYLEGLDLTHLAYGSPDAKSTTYSFWVYTNKTGRYGFSTISRSSNDAYDVWGSYFDVHTANAWQKIIFTVEGNTSDDIKFTNSFGLLVDIYLAVGDNRDGTPYETWGTYGTARVPQTTYVDFCDSTSNIFYITGVQLELGKVATPFEHRGYGEELALCQRYFQRLEWKGGNTIVALQFNSVSGLFSLNYTRKRADPEFVLPTAVTGTNQANGISLLTATGAYRSSPGTVTASHISRDSCRINLNGFSSSGSAGDATWAYFTSNTSNPELKCFIDIDAEL